MPDSKVAQNPIPESSSDKRPFQFENDHGKRSKLEWIALSFTFLGLIYLGYLSFHPWLTLQNSDGATFYILAAALKQGLGYELISLPYPEHVFNLTPIWPVMLSGLMGMANTMDPFIIVPLAKWALLGLFIIILALFNQGIRGPLGHSTALILTLFLAVNGSIHHYMGDLLSDIPYLLFSLVSIGFFLKRDTVESAHQKKKAFVAGLLFLALSIMTCPIGLALGIAVMGVELLRKQWKSTLAVMMTCVVVFGSWSLMEHHYRAERAVGDPAVQAFIDDSPVKLAEEKNAKAQSANDFLSQSIHRLEHYGILISKTFWPVKSIKTAVKKTSKASIENDTKQWEKIPGISKWLFFALTLGLLALGWRATDEKYRLITFYPVAYMGILLVYPSVSERYLIPILPFLIILFFMGLKWMLTRLQQLSFKASPLTLRRRVSAITAFIALLALIVQLQSASGWWIRNAHITSSNQGPQTSASYTALYRSLIFLHNQQKHQKAPAILIAREAELSYYYSGIKAIRYPFYPEKKHLFSWLKQQQKKYAQDFPGGLYILEDQAFKESQKFLTPSLQLNKNQLDLIYTAPQSSTHIWKIKDENK